MSIVDQIRYLLLEGDVMFAAEMVVSGAPFWGTKEGGIGVAHNAVLINLDPAGANQLKNFLPSVKPHNEVRRLGPESFPAHIRELLGCSPARVRSCIRGIELEH